MAMTRSIRYRFCSKPNVAFDALRYPVQYVFDSNHLGKRMDMTGKFLCGAISYTCSTDPVFTGNCHCTDCKKSSGSGYAPTMFFPVSSVTISGDAKYFASPGKSGKMVNRGFCQNCGSQLFGKPEGSPDMIAIRAGTLDDPSQYKPQIDLFTSHAVGWDTMDQDLPKFPEMPPM